LKESGPEFFPNHKAVRKGTVGLKHTNAKFGARRVRQSEDHEDYRPSSLSAQQLKASLPYGTASFYLDTSSDKIPSNCLKDSGPKFSPDPCHDPGRKCAGATSTANAKGSARHGNDDDESDRLSSVATRRAERSSPDEPAFYRDNISSVKPLRASRRVGSEFSPDYSATSNKNRKKLHMTEKSGDSRSSPPNFAKLSVTQNSGFKRNPRPMLLASLSKGAKMEDVLPKQGSRKIELRLLGPLQLQPRKVLE
jgi:hypothetical protein